MSQLLTDEIGQAFEITQENETRIRGKACLSTNIAIVKDIADFISTSFGPTGMDKILQSKDDDISISNDGATILKEMDMSENPISQLIVQLSKAQDDEVGDGTTGVVILTSALLQQANQLLSKGVHPVRITEGFERALKLSIEHLEKIADNIEDKEKAMVDAAKTSLNSKIVSKAMEKFARICVDAVMSVADVEREDVDFDLVKILHSTGKDVSETELINGLVIKKEFSHPQMKKEVKDAKVALLACPFEPPKLKNKHSLIIKNAEEYRELQSYERETFVNMIKALKDVGADLVLCQWGFDDEANSLLMENSLPAVRWVGGNDLGLISKHIGGNIISRFEDLKPEDLGRASVSEVSLGTENEKMLMIENSSQKKSVSILVRGANDIVIEEAKRSIQDAMSAVRNVLINKKVVYGGGSAELSTSIFLEEKSKEYEGDQEECVLAFSRALEDIPLILARNSGFDAMDYLTSLRKSQVESDCPYLGVDCFENDQSNMKILNVFDTFSTKVKQLQMATELACSILKISDVIVPN
ncbi:T-complex protein 1 subunit epsilon [Nosema granulosis]|uniref:T-complex protein 1 subunit epsilon n=1 Tax=Nosema granulosis TaxID=83296 RepID=A0A9P6L037_9MICR|nr:T-complex protein 1 subunit epsilon [Nosema granulosis]